MNAPPSIALAMMAAALAEQRLGGTWMGHFTELGCTPCTRWEVSRWPQHSQFSAEYYRIIDRISAGEQP